MKDEDLRKKYDMYGEAGLEDGPTGRGYQSYNFYQQDFGKANELSEKRFDLCKETLNILFFVCGHKFHKKCKNLLTVLKVVDKLSKAGHIFMELAFVVFRNL